MEEQSLHRKSSLTAKPVLYLIIKEKIHTSTEIYTSKQRDYDGLTDVGYNRHYRELIMEKMNSPRVVISILTTLRIFGILPRDNFQNSMTGAKKNFKLHLKKYKDAAKEILTHLKKNCGKS